MDIARWRELRQQWLPFDFEDEVQEQKQEEKQLEPKEEKPLPHYEHPESDNQKLLEFQYQFKNGRGKALDDFYKLSVQICLKFIYTIAEENPHVRALSYEDKRIKAHDAATYLPRRYLEEPDFKIYKNAPGYLYLRVLRELYHMRKVDCIVDFVDLDTFFKEGELDEENDEVTDWTT